LNRLDSYQSRDFILKHKIIFNSSFLIFHSSFFILHFSFFIQNMPYLVTLRSFEQRAEALIYKRLLAEHGITSFVETVERSGALPLDSDEVGAVRLSVLQSEAEEALEILHAENLSSTEEIVAANPLVLIKKMSLAEEAYLYQARLEHEGFTCFLVNKHASNPLPLLGLTAGTIELYVPKQEAAAAQQLLQTLDHTLPTPTEMQTFNPLWFGLILVVIVIFLLVRQYFDMF
jgi:hypothetical protein